MLILHFFIILFLFVAGCLAINRMKALNKTIQTLKDLRVDLSNQLETLNTEKARIVEVLVSMEEGVVAVDSKNKIILANPMIEKVFKVVEPEIIGKTIREGIRSNEIAEIVEQAGSKKTSVNREVKTAEKIFSVNASPIAPGGTVCVIHEITKLKKLETYRKDFVANISHELKTPLTAIRSLVETLIAGAVDDKNHNRSFLEKIEKHAVNLSSLIEDILQISRFEEEDSSGSFKKNDIIKAVSSAVETVAPKADRKEIKLECQFGQKEIVVFGIEDLIYRAVLNLLDNAVNYTEKGGRVAILCRENDGRIEVAISDTGIGISAEHLPRIFERFYRVDAGRSRDAGGTGLGLAIVKHIMNIHKGRVEVESEDGKGSTFKLMFPVQ